MKLRIGYLKERKLVTDVDNWTVQQLEEYARKLFLFQSSDFIGIYMGDRRINDSGSTKISEIGVVSGDLLIVKVESNKVVSSADNHADEKMEISIDQPSTSSSSEEEFIELDSFSCLLEKRMKQLGYERCSDYRLEESFAEIDVSYFKCPKSRIQIRAASTLFFSNIKKDKIKSIHMDVTLINDDKLAHLDRFSLDSATKLKDFDEFIHDNIKVAIFGPDNDFLKAMFCNDANLTLKMFELCGLESVIELRKVCRIAYKMSNSCFLDQHYWKQELVKAFGEDQLKSVNKNDPTPYRKALFKEMRDRQRAAYFNSMVKWVQPSTMTYQPQEIYGTDTLFTDPYYVPRREPRFNFNDNFYGDEIYRIRNPNARNPGDPIIYPRIRDDPSRTNRFI